jgi:hypothetical protein
LFAKSFQKTLQVSSNAIAKWCNSFSSIAGAAGLTRGTPDAIAALGYEAGKPAKSVLTTFGTNAAGGAIDKVSLGSLGYPCPESFPNETDCQYLIRQCLPPIAGQVQLSSFLLTSLPFGPTERKYLHAIAHVRVLNRAKHSGSDLLDEAGRGRYLTDTELKALSPYGQLFFCYLEMISQLLGTYG